MKSLILIFLMASVAGAQTPSPAPSVADVARQSRARRNQTTTTKVYTTDDIRTVPAAEEQPVAEAGQEAEVTETAAEAPAVAADPAQQWTAETEKLRARIRELLDQDAVTQLEINDITNRVYSPVTTVSARDQALAELGVAQQKLGGIREQIEKARADLQEREAKGPPKS